MRQQRRGIDSVWTLLPVMFLMIPLLAVSNSVLVSAAVALVLIMSVGGLVARSLMTHRHQLQLEEIDAQIRLSQYESHQLAQANLVIEQNAARQTGASELRDLRQALGDAVPPPPRIRDRVRVSELFGR